MSAESYFISNMDSTSSRQQLNLSDLPIGALSHVSSFLTLPSRALFAVALNYYRDESSSAIVGEQRDVLDFGNIEKELAAKLTDDDVRDILLSIDAVNNLKTLRLTNLLNITGIGLEPLRGSTTIEKIDLSLVGDNVSPDLSPTPPISSTDVLPILDSIIDMGGASSLKLLTFPNEWRKERSTDSAFHAFLIRYNELLCSRVDTCLKCNRILDNNSMLQISLNIERAYGMQFDTCYDCMKHFCHECVEHEDGAEIGCLGYICGICNRRFCLHCSRERGCFLCGEWFCVDCMDVKQCAECEKSVCLGCISSHENVCLNCISERILRSNVIRTRGRTHLPPDDVIRRITTMTYNVNWDE